MRYPYDHVRANAAISFSSIKNMRTELLPKVLKIRQLQLEAAQLVQRPISTPIWQHSSRCSRCYPRR